jgi:hypothetical protein
MIGRTYVFNKETHNHALPIIITKPNNVRFPTLFPLIGNLIGEVGEHEK